MLRPQTAIRSLAPTSSLLSVLSILALVGVWFCGSIPAEASYRLASLAPQDSAWGKLIQNLARDVDNATGGTVQFQLYLGGKLGDEAKVMKKLGKGLDGAFFTGQGIGLILPAYRVQELPFLCESYSDADKVRSVLWPLFAEAFEKETDYVLLGPGETGMIHLFSKQPIDSVEGLRQARLWVWEGDAVASDTFKVFGVSPRPFDILTVVQQLKSSGIDTVYNSAAGAVALGWTGDLRYMSARPFAYASGGYVMTKKAWNTIPEDRRATVGSMITKYSELMIQQARKENDAAALRLVGSGGGLSTVPISDEKYAGFRKIGAAAWPSLAKALKAEAYLVAARTALGK